MKIYTKTGDSGETGLFGGPRVRKDDLRIEAYGTVDELNSVLGLARAEGVSPEVDELLASIQNELFALGAQLATPDPAAHQTALVTANMVGQLERAIDLYDSQLEPLRSFILPGGTKAAAFIHVARTVCRRAERRVVTLAASGESIGGEILIYLNRLSDLLFVLARAVNAQAGQAEQPWGALEK